ncbi:WD repeat-containing protein 46-like [Styela clava]
MTTRYFRDQSSELDNSEEVIKVKEKRVNLKNSSDKKFRKKSNDAKSDPFPGAAPIPDEKVELHKRGSTNQTDVTNVKLKGKLISQEKKYEEAAGQAARHELFLTEEAGFLEAEEGEETYTIHQSEIKNHVDIASARKQFELNLKQFGPYRMNYTRNGRYLLLGGKRGHVAAFEWNTKKLLCEINVMESVNDVRWLHTENMFAVAQKKWVYVYDNQGVELHCLKNMHQPLRLDYLPYHFLLVSTTNEGFLHYLDISIGKNIASIRTKGRRLNVLAQNPYNAIMLTGHHNGTVSMWSPNMKEPLVQMLCHKSAIRAIAVDKTGLYMATSGQDGKMKIFDIRTYRPLHAYRVMSSPSNLKFSQRGLLSATCSNIVEVYRDPCREIQKSPYLIHKLAHPAETIEFCPYEDVLGIGRDDGFESILVPGAGEPNYDSMESNPYRSKSQRREWEIKALMEKIQPDMITLDPHQISAVDRVTAQQLRKDKEERMGFVKEEKKFEPKFKKKGRSSAGNIEKRKQVVKDSELRDKIKKDMDLKRKITEQPKDDENSNPYTFEVSGGKNVNRSALSRFVKKR